MKRPSVKRYLQCMDKRNKAPRKLKKWYRGFINLKPGYTINHDCKFDRNGGIIGCTSFVVSHAHSTMNDILLHPGQWVFPITNPQPLLRKGNY